MPPIARSVVHGEAANLINTWVDTVLPMADTQDDEVCTGLLGVPGLALSVPEVAKAYAETAKTLKSADQRRATAP